MAYGGLFPPPTSYSIFRSGSDLSSGFATNTWHSPAWHPFRPDFFLNQFPTSHAHIHHGFQHPPNIPQLQSEMSPYPWLVGLTLLSNLRAQELPLREKFSWSTVDFTWPTPAARQDAIDTGKYVPVNNLPLGIETWNGRTFVTLPKWKTGIPVTLAVVNNKQGRSPLLQPYPSWTWHKEGNCNGLTSVFRLSIDQCGRLWVLDSGVVDILNTTSLICPSQLVVFDLRTDKLLWRYRIPKDQLKEGSLFTNIVTDVREGKCEETYAYLTDVFRYGIVVYNWKEDKSWRVSHNLFYPDPLASRYSLDNITFRWTDGVFGVALSPIDDQGDRTLYFHPMSSFREFSVPTSILRNDTADDNPELFQALGEPRGKENQHSSSSVMDRRGILLFNLVTQNAVGCWDSKKPYTRPNIGNIGQDPEILNFPNDLKLDHNDKQNIWVLTNKLHKYLYTSLSPDEINFRILSAPVEEATKGTICDPEIEPAVDLRPPGCIEDEL